MARSIMKFVERGENNSWPSYIYHEENDEDKQEQSSPGVEEGENSSQNEPEIRTQASGENGEKLCSLTTYLLN